MTDQETPGSAGQQPTGGEPEAKGAGGPGPRRPRRVVSAAAGVGVAVGLAAGLVVSAVVDPGSGGRAGLGAGGGRGGNGQVTGTGPGPVGGVHPARLTGALTSFGGCDSYLSYVRAQAEAQVGPYGLNGPAVYPYAASTGGAALRGGAAPADAVQATPAFGAASDAASAGASASASPQALDAPAATFSQTNDQVSGVDEPDTVKTDGHTAVTLQGSTLHVVDLSGHAVGSLNLPGDTGGGFLLIGHQAVVLSSASAPAGSPAMPYPRPYLQPYGEPVPSPSQATAAVVDLSDPAHPVVTRTFLFDGTIVAARLVGGRIRLVERTDGPRLSFVTPSGTGQEATATATNRSLIATSTVQDWLPAWQVQSPDGSTSARQPISSCDAVSRPQQSVGLSTVSVLELDPQQDAPGPGTSVVGAGDTVYATAAHLYVAGETRPPVAQPGGMLQYGCCTVVPPNGATTEIYAFDTPASGPPVFTGSGSVPGWLVNSYAMDETAAGLLRVASTEVSSSGTTDAEISVLRPSGSQLTVAGSVGGLGRGEVIRAVRYIGDMAYVVTFRSFDPLYVVDLHDPTHPVLTGQLDQPGFSEFLYPLPGGRLLGVGVQITDNEPSGLLVATYDVSDPSHPTRIDSSVLADGFQYGTQGYDPHAFLYWSPANLALLALPNGYSGGGGSGVAAYTIGSDGRLARSATIGHSPDDASRSLVIGGQVWVVATTGIVTAPLSDLGHGSWHAY